MYYLISLGNYDCYDLERTMVCPVENLEDGIAYFLSKHPMFDEEDIVLNELHAAQSVEEVREELKFLEKVA